MVKAIVYAISKVNDFKVLLLPNGEFAPMETTEKLHLEDEIFIQDFGLGGVTFEYNTVVKDIKVEKQGKDLVAKHLILEVNGNLLLEN